MKTFPLVISTPDGEMLRDAVACISLRGALGDLAVMAGHVPFITAVQPCDCTIKFEDGSARIGHTEGGLLTVSHENVTLLSGKFFWQ